MWQELLEQGSVDERIVESLACLELFGSEGQS